MEAIVRQAIIDLYQLEISYPPGKRTVEPHALGYGADGQLLLRAYQVSGASASGEHEHWKLFRLDRVSGGSSNGTNFPGPRPGFKRGDKAMKHGIIAQL